jgi:putative membrane protein
MAELLRLLAGTVTMRPYVFVFLAVYLLAAVTKMGWRRTAAFTAIAWAVAYAAEFSSTRNGFPFGLYHYVDVTRDRELWLSNVPFFDSLSFSFLCYVGFALAVLVWSPLLVVPGDVQVADTRAMRTSVRVALTGAFLTMLLDLVIDPVTVLGERWFLGRIYYYPDGGIHFGVPLSNYAGWFLVALVTLLAFQALERTVFARGGAAVAGVRHLPYGGLIEPLVYLGIVGFNLTVTFWIGETALGVVGAMLFAPVVVFLLTHLAHPMRRASAADVARHLRDFPESRVAGATASAIGAAGRRDPVEAGAPATPRR